MKQRYFYAILFLVFLFSTSHAETTDKICHEKGNKIVCGAGITEQVNYLNDVVFNGTTVLGHTKVLGDVSASNTHFNTVDIIGDIKADNTEVAGNAKLLGDQRYERLLFHADVNITGDMKVTESKFLHLTKIVGDIICHTTSFAGDLIITSAATTLTNTTTHNIEFTPDKRQQILYLTDSVVNGSIKFSSNNGVIYSENSSINGGVIGGRVINR